MGLISDWNTAFRDYVTDGVPSSGVYQPQKSLIRSLVLKIFQPPRWTTAEQYGAVGDGATDDTAALQAAIDAMSALGGGIVYCMAHYLSTSLTLRAGVVLKGAGMYVSSIARASALAAPLVAVDVGAANVGVQDLTLDGASAADATSLLGFGISGGSNSLISRVRFLNGMGRWALRSDWSTAISNLAITDCVFKNCPSGGLIFLPSVKGSKNIWICRNTFDQVGANILAIHDVAGVDRWNCTLNVHIDENIITNCLNTGASGPIPVETWSLTGGSVSNNQIDSGTRGLSVGAHNQDLTISGNTVQNQTLYGAEGGPSRRLNIVGNVFENCRTGITYTSGADEVRDVLIAHNIFAGTGLSVYDATAKTIGAVAGTAIFGLTIRDNVFIDQEFVRGVIDVRAAAAGGGTSVFAQNNVIISSTFNSVLASVNISGDYAEVSGNTILRSANYDNTHYSASDAPNFIQRAQPPSGARWVAHHNRIAQLGVISGGAYICGIGLSTAPANDYGISIQDNTLDGTFSNNGAINCASTAGDTIITANDLSGVTSAPLYGSIQAETVYRDLVRRFSRNAAPTTGTFIRGDIVDNEVPAAGQPTGWVCTAGGTPGTWVARANL